MRFLKWMVTNFFKDHVIQDLTGLLAHIHMCFGSLQTLRRKFGNSLSTNASFYYHNIILAISEAEKRSRDEKKYGDRKNMCSLK
jgi:hypothetical protein